MRDTPMWRRHLRFLGLDPAADVDDEIAFHFETRVEELTRAGVPEAEARDRAGREFGDVRRVRGELRAIGRKRLKRERRARGWESLAQDVRFAARTLRKGPGFAAVAVLTLALGIGASTAMFTLVNSVLLRPLGYADPERLVSVAEVTPGGEGGAPTSPANYDDWKEGARSFTDLAAAYGGPENLTGEGGAEQVVMRATTANYFTLLGVDAGVGRVYGPGEELENIVVLSHAFWRRRFNADPALLGRSISLSGQTLQVVGVMPESFRSTSAAPDLWVPVPYDPEWRGRFLEVVGRLRPGVTVEQAREEMRALHGRLGELYPANAGWSAEVVPLHERITGGVRPALLVLLGAVGLLLLIACANVANLLLGRAVARRRELAVRLSLGATRGRLVRQTLTESLILSGVAGVLGLGLAVWGTGALASLLPADLALPRLDEVRADLRVLGFALGVSLLTGIVFGTVPALSGSAVRLAETLRESTRGAGGGRNGLRRALVVVEVALAVILLVGAGLLGRSLQRLMAVDTGLRTESVLTLQVTLSGESYESDAGKRAFMDALLARLEALPGAREAAGEMYLPLTGAKVGHVFWRGDRPEPPEEEQPGTDIRVVAGDYFAVLGIPVLRGRAFDGRDRGDAPAAFLINEELARRHYPGEDPVGKPITYPWIGGPVSGEIVGVVGNVREMGPTAAPAPAIYRPYAQFPSPEMTMLVRTDGDPLALASAAEAAVRDIDPNQPVARIRSMDQVAAETVARPRFNLYLLGGFAAMALLLAGLGLYAIISYSVTQRRHEIGVRVALGARRGDVIRLVVRQGLALTAAGLAIGLGAALVATRAMSTLLFDVRPTDPATMAGVALFLAAVALLASWLPGLRATRVDPAVALRGE